MLLHYLKFSNLISRSEWEFKILRCNANGTKKNDVYYPLKIYISLYFSGFLSILFHFIFLLHHSETITHVKRQMPLYQKSVFDVLETNWENLNFLLLLQKFEYCFNCKNIKFSANFGEFLENFTIFNIFMF